MNQDAFSQHCSIYGIPRERRAKQVLGIIHRVILGKNLEISLWDIISILLLNNADVLCLDVASNLVYPVDQLDLVHYTLSLPLFNSEANVLNDLLREDISNLASKYIILECITGSDLHTAVAKSLLDLLSAANTLNGHNGSKMLHRDRPLYIYLQHPLFQICNVKYFQCASS